MAVLFHSFAAPEVGVLRQWKPSPLYEDALPACESRLSEWQPRQPHTSMRVFVQFGHVLGCSTLVQLLNRVLVLVFRLLAESVNMGMRVLVRVGVLVSVRVLGPVCVGVLVGVDVRMHVRVGMIVLNLIGHRDFLL